MAEQALRSTGTEATELQKIDRRRGRTTVSLAAMQELQGMARKLNDYRCRMGTVVVVRSPKTKALAEWAFNLRDTYRKSPNGRRVAWVSRRFPELHGAMVMWAAKENGRLQATPATFELQAAVFMEFLVRFKRAPSQSAQCKEESNLAKWLSRRLSMEANSRSKVGTDVLVRLQAIAKSFRQGGTNAFQGLGYDDAIYDLVAELWCRKADKAQVEDGRTLRGRIARREVFWASPEWMESLEK